MYRLEVSIYGTAIAETIEDINTLCERIDFYRAVDSQVIAAAQINESILTCVYLWDKLLGIICNKLNEI